MFFNRFSQNLLIQRNGLFPNAKVMSNSPIHESAASPNSDEVNERDELRGPKASPKPIENKLIGGKGNDKSRDIENKLTGAKGSDKPANPTTINLNDDSIELTEEYDRIVLGPNDDCFIFYGDTRTTMSIDGCKENNFILGRDDHENFLIGNQGEDTIIGRNLDDTINGGQGNDIMEGGSGADTFILSSGTDLIRDFSPDEGDRFTLGQTMSNKAIGFSLEQSGDDVLVKTSEGVTRFSNSNIDDVSDGFILSLRKKTFTREIDSHGDSYFKEQLVDPDAMDYITKTYYSKTSLANHKDLYHKFRDYQPNQSKTNDRQWAHVKSQWNDGDIETKYVELPPGWGVAGEYNGHTILAGSKGENFYVGEFVEGDTVSLTSKSWF